MPVDSKQKRASATFFMRPGPVYIVPDGTISATDRQAATWLYSGIAAAAPVVIAKFKKGMLLGVYNNGVLVTNITIGIDTERRAFDKGIQFTHRGRFYRDRSCTSTHISPLGLQYRMGRCTGDRLIRRYHLLHKSQKSGFNFYN